MKLLVAIPVYNCEKQINRVISEFSDQLLSHVDEIIIIDNRSSDLTVENAQFAASSIKLNKIKIIRNNHNYGLGGSQKIAFMYAQKKKFDYVAVLHGDNQATTSELENLINLANMDPELDAILGSRFMRNSQLIGYSNQRVWGNRIINIIYSLVSLRHSSDLGSGLNLFRAAIFINQDFLQFANDITFNIDLLLNLFQLKAKIVFTPITWSETDQVSNAKNYTVAKRALTKLILWRTGNPYREEHVADEYSYETVYP